MQYRLRTLFIVVTVLSVPMAYFGSQVRTIRERQRGLDWLHSRHAGFETMSEWLKDEEIWLGHKVAPDIIPHTVPWIRRCLGDVEITLIIFTYMGGPTTAEDIERARALFPEADIHPSRPVP